MNITMKKMVSLLIAVMMVCGVVVISSKQTYAAKKKYKLPVRLITYEYKNGKWKKQSDYKYKFDSKGNIVKWDGTKLKNKYKKGKLTKVTIKDKNDYGKYTTVKTYKKGRIAEMKYDLKWTEDGVTDKIIFKFKYDKKGYIKQRIESWNGSKSHVAVKYKCKYGKNGLPTKITAKGDVNQTEKYDKNGLPKSGSDKEDGKKDSWKNKTKYSKGVVKEVIETHKDGRKYKYVYKYGKAKTTDKKKYVSFIGMTQGSLSFQVIGDTSAINWCWWDTTYGE